MAERLVTCTGCDDLGYDSQIRKQDAFEVDDGYLCDGCHEDWQDAVRSAMLDDLERGPSDYPL